MNTHNIKLPPLPPGDAEGLYGDFDMEAYAIEAIQLDRQGRGEPVAWQAVDHSGYRPQPTAPTTKESLTVAEPETDMSHLCEDHTYAGKEPCPKCEDAWRGLTPQPAEPVKVPSPEEIESAVRSVTGDHKSVFTKNDRDFYGELIRELFKTARPAASVEPIGRVRVHDDSQPTYLDGIECQYSIAKGEPWPYSETLAYVFDKEIADRIAAALNAAPVAAQPSVPDESAALDHFEQRFNEIEEGDGDIPLPRMGDGKRWDEYVERHSAALTGWVLRREYEQSQRAVDKAWAQFQAALPAPSANLQPQGQCAECGKRACDGWALYCVKCGDVAHGQAQQAADKVNAPSPEWMACESRRPYVVNSLKHQSSEMRLIEKRCRNAFKKEFMGVPSQYLADTYAEAAVVFETRLAAIDAATQQERQP